MEGIKKDVQFYLQKRKQWNEDFERERQVILWFNYQGVSLNTTIGIKVALKNWSEDEQRVKKGVTHYREVNQYLALLEEKLNDIYYKALSEGIRPTNSYLLEMLKGTDKKVISFFDEWDKYLGMQSVKLQPSTIKSAKTAYKHFKEFCKNKRISNMTFEKVTPNLKSEFADYLLGIGNSNNTIHAVQKRMTRFLNYAKKIGLHNNDTHKEFTIQERVGSIKFLEWEEVKKLIDVEVEPGLESDSRDLFVWCCLTAMRYSDVAKLRKADIREYKFNNMAGIHYAAHVRQKKTGKTTIIPLMPEAMAILDRYKNEKSEFALPKRANQTVNRVIKVVARRAKLNSLQELVVYRGTKCETTYEEKWKVLSSHFGRRTFATIALNRGIPINVICSITGQDPKIMLTHYAGIIDSARFEHVQDKLRF